MARPLAVWAEDLTGKRPAVLRPWPRSLTPQSAPRMLLTPPESPPQRWSPSGSAVPIGEPLRTPVELKTDTCDPAPSNPTSLITLHKGKRFTGRELEVFGDCDNFQAGLLNRVSAIRVESGAWVCFYHPDFQGQQFVLEHGNDPDFSRWNGHHDHMGSCRPVGVHGEHFRLEIFEGYNFTGQCLEFKGKCPFLQGRGWAKNCVNTIKVYGDGAWVLEESNYHGRMYLVERGDFRSFSDWGAHSARVQSLRSVVNF
ncbi:LOW QUALITY PROTEIN: gamma-crystallin N [Hipposideros larvatus]